MIIGGEKAKGFTPKTLFCVLAILSLRRRLISSILSLAIISVFIIMIAASASISNNMSIQAKEYIASLGSSFSITLAPIEGGGYYEEREMELYGTVMTIPVYIGPKITKGLVEKISEVKGIQNYNIINSSIMETQLSLAPGLFSHTYYDWEEIGYPSDDREIAESAFQKRFTTIYFVLKSELHPYFQNEAFSLISGEHITGTDKNVALISEYIAEKNNLTIGDIITLSENAGYDIDTFRQFDKILGNPIPVKIIGVYRINFAQEPSVYTPETEIADNFIFSDMATARMEREIFLANKGVALEDLLSMPIEKAVFFVDSPGILDEVVQDVRDLDELRGIPFLLEKDTLQYEALVAPLRTIRNFTTVIFIALLIGSIIAIGLIQSLFARNRACETGTLWALGFSENAIIAQRLIEFTVLCGLALIIAMLFIQSIVNVVGAFSINILFPYDNVIDYSIYYDEVAHENVITLSSGKPGGIDFKTEYQMLFTAFLLTWAPGAFFHIKAMKTQFRKPPRKIINTI